MAARRGRTQSQEREFTSRLHVRVGQLEDRLALLEAKVRRISAQSEALAHVALRPLPKIRPVRERPRCPGCRLELPKGRKGDACVWCGFVFDAVPAAKH